MGGFSVGRRYVGGGWLYEPHQQVLELMESGFSYTFLFVGHTCLCAPSVSTMTHPCTGATASTVQLGTAQQAAQLIEQQREAVAAEFRKALRGSGDERNAP